MEYALKVFFFLLKISCPFDIKVSALSISSWLLTHTNLAYLLLLLFKLAASLEIFFAKLLFLAKSNFVTSPKFPIVILSAIFEDNFSSLSKHSFRSLF